MDLFSYIESQEYQKSENVQQGFRLDKIELLNWGTFHKNIWTMKVDGNTALLTGDIGSGKSTIVDALTTLLVPPQKIKFNNAAGANAKERNITSYVRGFYGQERSYEGKGKALALRDFDTYSVILATFKNRFIGEEVTMAQVFYFRDSSKSPERFYVVSNDELHIKNHFTNFNHDIRFLKKRLKEQNNEVFDNFSQYSVAFRKRLGHLNHQAIDIFAQTISMKKVDELTSFVRGSMLEPIDMQPSVDKLLEHYNDLNASYNAILKAKNQIEHLTPIKENYVKYEKECVIQNKINEARSALESFLSTRKKSLYEVELTKHQRLFEESKQSLLQSQETLKSIENDIDFIKREIDKNDGSLVETLKSKRNSLQTVLETKQMNVRSYEIDAKIVDLVVPSDVKMFNENVGYIEQNIKLNNEKENVTLDLLMNIQANISQEKQSKKTIDDEISSLKTRKTNIPSHFISLKQKMCQQLQIPIEDISYIGELLQVKLEEQHFEGAIERLLHSFALSLAIPAQYYGAVSKWVNQNDLKTKLVYFKVNQNISFNELELIDENSIINKIDISPKTKSINWLKQELFKRFNYIACLTVEQMYDYKQAITKEGQIKSFGRHEKDDRKHVQDRSSYILGFSNERKIIILEEKSDEYSQIINQYLEDEKELKEKYQNIRTIQTALQNIQKFQSFDQIDIYSLKNKIQEIENRIQEIAQNNHSLKKLQEQLEQLNITKIKAQDKNNHWYFNVEKQKEEIKSIEKDKTNNELKINSSIEQKTIEYLQSINSKAVTFNVLTLENSIEYDRQFDKYLISELQKASDRVHQFQNNTQKLIVKYIAQYPIETKDIDDTINSALELIKKLDDLMLDDLPQFEQRFKQKLQLNLIRDIANFNQQLQSEYGEIRKKINVINEALGQIDYNVGRYIKIEHEDSQDSEIKLFKAKLRECTENAAQGFDDVDVAKQKFHQIKELIDRFQGRVGEADYDAKWRKKVIDVRNWAIFSATERFKDTHELYEYYTDSGGKSGGQKEKLAYTILAAGLAYNFGLSNAKTKEQAFRFVVIDEAFLKSSDESAKYGLTLFKELDFQLLVVTPLAKIHTIEPFISSVGFVSNNPLSHESSLLSLTIDEYIKRREASTT